MQGGNARRTWLKTKCVPRSGCIEQRDYESCFGTGGLETSSTDNTIPSLCSYGQSSCRALRRAFNPHRRALHHAVCGPQTGSGPGRQPGGPSAGCLLPATLDDRVTTFVVNV